MASESKSKTSETTVDCATTPSEVTRKNIHDMLMLTSQSAACAEQQQQLNALAYLFDGDNWNETELDIRVGNNNIHFGALPTLWVTTSDRLGRCAQDRTLTREDVWPAVCAWGLLNRILVVSDLRFPPWESVLSAPNSCACVLGWMKEFEAKRESHEWSHVIACMWALVSDAKEVDHPNNKAAFLRVYDDMISSLPKTAAAQRLQLDRLLGKQTPESYVVALPMPQIIEYAEHEVAAGRKLGTGIHQEFDTVDWELTRVHWGYIHEWGARVMRIRQLDKALGVVETQSVKQQ